MVPSYYDEARIRASVRSNIEPWLQKLWALMAKNCYESDMIHQLDETSCQVTEGKAKKRVTAAKTVFLPILSVPPIACTTLCFIVDGEGGHCQVSLIISFFLSLSFSFFQTPMLIPSSYKKESFADIRNDNFKIFQTAKGWMTKDCFKKIMKTVFIPHVLKKREQIKTTNRRALLILDSHTSRINKPLIRLLKRNEIDCLLLPSHASHLLQGFTSFFLFLFLSLFLFVLSLFLSHVLQSIRFVCQFNVEISPQESSCSQGKEPIF